MDRCEVNSFRGFRRVECDRGWRMEVEAARGLEMG